MADPCEIVPFEPTMQDGVIAVVRAVHDEYGFTWESAGYHRDLYDIRAAYLEAEGMFWAAREAGRIVGCVGVTSHGPEAELHRLYIDRGVRGRGIGGRLLDTAVDWGRGRGCQRMIAWSDVRLGLAHRLYLSRGFVLHGLRECADLERSIEYGFLKEPL
jgi:GNAT superfamily N-acetyltransferase